jgi:lipopolysaccharide transport system permease protein
MMFVSGVFFSLEMIPENMREAFLLNPMASILKLSRDVLMHGVSPDWEILGRLFFCSSFVLLIVIWMINRIGHIYPRLV